MGKKDILYDFYHDGVYVNNVKDLIRELERLPNLSINHGDRCLRLRIINDPNSEYNDGWHAPRGSFQGPVYLEIIRLT